MLRGMHTARVRRHPGTEAELPGATRVRRRPGTETEHQEALWL